MLNDEQGQALEALDRARDVRHEAWEESRWADLPALDAAVRSAWERVEQAFPTETVIELDGVPECDSGAPMPLVLSDGHHTWLAYDVPYPADQRAVLRFDRVDSTLFGGPNDEALHGHRLYGLGLSHYAFHEVVRSEWITARERENSVHSGHRGGWHADLRHFVFTFHDETFECLARNYAVQDPKELPRAVAALLDRSTGLPS